ncbi:unnamed protein product [Mucor fragilis]
MPEVLVHFHGAMDRLCSKCGTFMWIWERKLESSLTLPLFQMCCANGQAMLAPLRHIQIGKRDLLIRNNVIAKELKKNTATYNPALRLVSMNADLDTRYANE